MPEEEEEEEEEGEEEEEEEKARWLQHRFFGQINHGTCVNNKLLYTCLIVMLFVLTSRAHALTCNSYRGLVEAEVGGGFTVRWQGWIYVLFPLLCLFSYYLFWYYGHQ